MNATRSATRISPLFFHQETLNYEESGVLAHWHENIELLWFVDGRSAVVVDSVRVEAGPGELVIIDSTVYTASSH